jgi:hypothetical protein
LLRVVCLALASLFALSVVIAPLLWRSSFRCLARCYVRSFACLALSGSCLSSMASISGVSDTGSLSLLPREVEASEKDPSMTLSLPRPDSRLCSS